MHAADLMSRRWRGPEAGIVLRRLVVALAMTGTSAAFGQGWEPIDCRVSPIRLAASATCHRIAAPTAAGETGPLVTTTFGLLGRRGPYVFHVLYFPPLPDAPANPDWSAYSREDAQRLLRAVAGDQATQFGAYREFGQTGYIPFHRRRDVCTAFDHGAPRRDGYEFFVRGDICATGDIPDPERVITELLSALQIWRPGASGAVNAFRGAPVALPWEPAG